MASVWSFINRNAAVHKGEGAMRKLTLVALGSVMLGVEIDGQAAQRLKSTFLGFLVDFPPFFFLPH